MSFVKGVVVKESLCNQGQGIPQKSHHTTDLTQEIYCGDGEGRKMTAFEWSWKKERLDHGGELCKEYGACT